MKAAERSNCRSLPKGKIETPYANSYAILSLLRNQFNADCRFVTLQAETDSEKYWRAAAKAVLLDHER